MPETLLRQNAIFHLTYAQHAKKLLTQINDVLVSIRSQPGLAAEPLTLVIADAQGNINRELKQRLTSLNTDVLFLSGGTQALAAYIKQHATMWAHLKYPPRKRGCS